MKAKIIEYSSNKVRKTQNEHLIIRSLSKFDRSVVVNLSQFRIFLCFLSVETMGVIEIILWQLIFCGK